MKAVSPYAGKPGSGNAQEPSWVTVDDPKLAAGEVLVSVRSAALNRGDLLQMRGLYPPPPGASEVPGLEAAGVVVKVGPAPDGGSANGSRRFQEGDEVVALLAGGGQAELFTAPVGQLMPKPQELSWIEAGGLAEVALTAWTNLVVEGGLVKGQTVLITAAASGLGSYCVRLSRLLGADVIVAGRKRRRLEPLLELGAEACVTLEDDLVEQVKAHRPNGVDLVLDLVGGSGFSTALGTLKNRGRLVLLGLLGGASAELPLGDVLRRRLEIRGSVLRSRSLDEKNGLINSFSTFAKEHWASGELTPLVDRVLPFEEVAAAYRAMAEEEIFGKIVLCTEASRDGDD